MKPHLLMCIHSSHARLLFLDWLLIFHKSYILSALMSIFYILTVLFVLKNLPAVAKDFGLLESWNCLAYFSLKHLHFHSHNLHFCFSRNVSYNVKRQHFNITLALTSQVFYWPNIFARPFFSLSCWSAVSSVKKAVT